MTADQSILGVEFAGKLVTSGKRIMGLTNGSSLATRSRVHRLYLDVPDHWTLEQAATVPAGYFIAYLALERLANVENGERVLIHAGAGAVGLACCVVASHKGAEVFTTVSTEEKKSFILNFCPEVQSDHVFDSRSISFERDVMQATGGKGVDVIINSLAGPLLQASLRCLAVGGRFIEIGKADLVQRSKISLEHFNKNITFTSVNLVDYFWDASKLQRMKSAFELVRQGIKHGVVRPLPATVFDASDSSSAIRYVIAVVTRVACFLVCFIYKSL